jgi:hypothetical protein
MKKDIIVAKQIIDSKNITNKDNKYSQVYKFTNENICGISKNIDIKNKEVLTVCSSGAQYFSHLLNGAKTVDTFDISIFTKYFLHLNIAAIISLDYDEYLDFFFPKRHSLINNKYFNFNTYLKLRDNFKDKDSLEFWNALFWKYPSKKLYYSNLFVQNNPDQKNIIECCDYLKNEETYNLLRAKLKKIDTVTFYNTDIIDKMLETNKHYDFIYLSNILDKIYMTNKKQYLQFIKTILKKLEKHLKDNGEIGVCYLYCYLDDYWWSLDRTNFQALYQNNQLPTSDYTLKSFNGHENPNSNFIKNRDALILYKKRKN